VLVNPALPFDRNQTVISSGGLLQSPWGIAVETRGTIVVTDTGRLIRIDPSLTSPGNQTLVASGLPFASADNVEVEADGTIVVVNPANPGGLIRVNPVTGVQTVVADTGICPRAVAVRPATWSSSRLTLRVRAAGPQTVIAVPFNGLLADPLGIAVAPPR
jgi:sugar lactone lactonase YvrE